MDCPDFTQYLKTCLGFAPVLMGTDGSTCVKSEGICGDIRVEGEWGEEKWGEAQV